MRRGLPDVRVFAMQSEEDARRIIALGADPERVVAPANRRHEPAADAPGAVDLWRRLLGLHAGQRVWIAGSTHRGEEAPVLEAHRAARAECPDLTLVLAPRHPERTAEVLALVAAAGWPAVRRSELRRKPVLSGPHTHNFRESTALLEAAGAALVVQGAEDLGRALGRLLADGALRAKMGEAGCEAAGARRGAGGGGAGGAAGPRPRGAARCGRRSSWCAASSAPGTRREGRAARGGGAARPPGGGGGAPRRRAPRPRR